MSRNILVIGGTRYFGKNLVKLLLAHGDRVTIATRGRTRDDFGDKVQRIVVDRRNAEAMRQAFANTTEYDVIYDQMCYSPVDSAIAGEVFYGRTSRYIMSSTIGVYAHLRDRRVGLHHERDINVHSESIDIDLPWHDPALADALYCIGKRQAEAFHYQENALPAVSVRIAHVLGGLNDFTGRLQEYVRKVATGSPIEVNQTVGATSFLDSDEIAKFLVWAGKQSFLGPINAGCEGACNSLELYHKIAQILDVRIAPTVSAVLRESGELGSFDYTGSYEMDTQRAKRFGYRFSHVDQWLEKYVLEHAQYIKTGGMRSAAGAGF